MLCGSSTTQIDERSRCGSRQNGHSSASLILLHSAQMPRLSFTSVSAAASAAACSRGERST
jgi:hypothetical protein